MKFITVIIKELSPLSKVNAKKWKECPVDINIDHIVSKNKEGISMINGRNYFLTEKSMKELHEILSTTYEQLVAIETVTKIQVTKDSTLIFNIERLPISEKQLRYLREKLIENFKCNCIVLQPGIKLEAIIDNSELAAEFKVGYNENQ